MIKLTKHCKTTHIAGLPHYLAIKDTKWSSSKPTTKIISNKLSLKHPKIKNLPTVATRRPLALNGQSKGPKHNLEILAERI
jgi:hypothetical protein